MAKARQSVARQASALCHALHATSAPWLSIVEQFFRHIFDNRIKRDIFTSVSDSNLAFEQYVEHHNMNPKPFIRDATAADTLAKVTRAKRASGPNMLLSAEQFGALH